MHLLRPEDFEPWIGRKVRINTVPQPVEVTLSRIERTTRMPRELDFRQPFSLFFDSPTHIYLLDEICEVGCGKGGPYNIAIAQLQPSSGQRHYQAVFN